MGEELGRALRELIEAAVRLEEVARRVGPPPVPEDTPGWLRPALVRLVGLAAGGSPRVSFLGPRGSFSHEAVRAVFGGAAREMPAHSISAAVTMLVEGVVDYAVVPYENSIEGPVGETLRALAESADVVRVWAEYVHPIVLVLAARSDGEVRKVYGHPHALGEARDWLERNLPHAELIPVASTSKAAEMAAREDGAAAVCSRLAAELYGLRIVAEGLATRPNFTRFLVLHHRDNPETGSKTSIVAAVRHEPGSLYRLLEVFAERRINLTMIYSYPVPGSPWSYYFFIDMEGSRRDEKIREALEEAEKRALWLRVLGSYPVLHG
ncbi:prephenate dehydratase [Pyrolobus fumarii 1A]|uniref:prephenate dehydratase n=1 Tax=Pyrolobus fumarii (strain DSM 11204 / 1A) TaxID=694429 RepID=G0EG98_PYRF1|nr:prephenate dehydratase [Pyrolobus fumarii 1A]